MECRIARVCLQSVGDRGRARGQVGGLAWPQCIAALTEGEGLRGTWFDRSAEFVAGQEDGHRRVLAKDMPRSHPVSA
jgi:hypothetical protein